MFNDLSYKFNFHKNIESNIRFISKKVLVHP